MDPGRPSFLKLPPAIDAAFERSAIRSVAPLAAVLGPLYLAFAVAHPFALPAEQARIMTPIAAATGAVLLLLARRPIQGPRFAHLLPAAIAALVWVNVTAHVVLSRELHQTTNYALLIIGVGGLFLSIRLYLAVVAVTLASFVLSTRWATASTLVTHFSFLTLSATCLSLAVFIVRRVNLVRIEELRLREAAQAAAVARISARLQAVLDGMLEGIVVVGDDGAIEAERSAAAAQILGPSIAAGVPVVDLLFPEGGVEREAFEEWRGAVFGASREVWDELEGLAPTRVVHSGRPLSLEFRPLFEGERVAHVVVRIRDESERHALERAMREQEEAFARRLAAMRRLSVGSGEVSAFVRSAQARLVRCRALLGAGPAHAELLEQVHTLKGEADALGLDELRDAAHVFEDELATRSASPADGVAALERALSSTRELLVQASPIGERILSQCTVQSEDVARLLEIAGDRDDELGAIARRLAGRPFGELARAVVQRAGTWAASVDKQVDVVVEGGERPIDPALAIVLPGVLAHLVRNAIAHGIETASARAEAGKPAVGVVTLSCGKGSEITVRDDGRGIAPQIADRIFEAGTTTRAAVDRLSGRGVGLSAVAAELAEAGYVITTEPAPIGARFVVRPRV
ncbi:MAG: Hpt domain-containing protein [Myxococcales bacterium]|nr:Hpt domain-containing protein [Myxococcales bacterium]